MKKIKVVFFMLLLPAVYAICIEAKEKDKAGSCEKVLWRNTIHYFHQYPHYIAYKEPKDIIKNGCRWGVWVTFSTKVLAIEAKVGNWSKLKDLFHSMDFLAMYKHPLYYKQAALSYLREDFPTIDQKKIVIYGMSNTPFGFLLREYYTLYQQKKMAIEIFECVLQLQLLHIYDRLDLKREMQLCITLSEISSDRTISESLREKYSKILSGKVPQEWYQQAKKATCSSYGSRFPLKAIFQQMEKEYQSGIVERNLYGVDMLDKMNYIPYALMLVDHPCYYIQIGNDGLLLSEECPSLMERKWAIFLIQQGGICIDEVDSSYIKNGWYHRVLYEGCEAYRQGKMEVYLMQYLLQGSVLGSLGLPFKYPFYILDYNNPGLVSALNAYIAEPTIPCGLKALARKVKNGTLATKEEMAYMEGYRQFRKTHFTLYETIPPRGE